MNYDHEVTLIHHPIIEDGIGNQLPGEPQETKLLCRKESVSRAEFYNAASNGLKPSVVLIVHSYEYSDQKEVVFEGERYKVIRTYQTGFEEIELTCEKVTS